MNPLRFTLRFLIPTLLLVACGAGPRVVQIPGSDRNGDLVAYVGIVPSAMARERMGADATAQHPEVAESGEQHHLVVALFDATSGARVEQAQVVATHLSPRRSPVRRTLSPMRTGDVISFGGEFGMNKGPGHLFEIEARRSGAKPARFSFGYDNRHQ